MVFRTLIRSSKRLPLIKFRKGSHQTLSSSSTTPVSEQNAAGEKSHLQRTEPESYSPNAIEDWELPNRYRRQPISVDEMDYINRGGPA